MTLFPEDLSGGQDRLWRLIEKRSDAGVSVSEIDEFIWDLFGETWSVMFTDLSGFSRHVAEHGLLSFLQIIYRSRKILFPIADEWGAILIRAEADSFMFLMKKPSSAVQCAIEMQVACQKVTSGTEYPEEVRLCVGIGYGRVLRLGDHDVYGEEVNAASKLGEDQAAADEILVTSQFLEAVGSELGDLHFEPAERGVPKGAYRVVYGPG